MDPASMGLFLLEVCWATNLLPWTGSLTERDKRPMQTGRRTSPGEIHEEQKQKRDLSVFSRASTIPEKGAGSMAGAWLSAWPWHELMAQEDLNPIEENWDAGVVRHLLPAVNHSTF